VLRQRGLEKDTVVIYTLDHGDGAAAHHWTGKPGPYEEEVAVPFIIAGKGVPATGFVDRTRLVSGIDVLPAVCGYVGASMPAKAEGMDLRPLITDPSLPGRDHVVIEVGPIGGDPEDWQNGGNGRIIRSTRWKYARFDSREETLFDLNADPGETRNLAGEAAVAPILAAHRWTLEEYIRKTGDHFRMEGLNRSKPQTGFPGEDPDSDEPHRLTSHPGYPDHPDGTEDLARFSAPVN
jgi:arylsulfatase A-like enzyme